MARSGGPPYGTGMPAKTKTPRMEWTGNPEADRLVATDPAALLIGFCLDQQIPVEKAFMGPLAIRERLGTVDPTELARMDAARLEEAFRRPPAVHRFPGSMAHRVQALCSVIAEQYGGDAARIWNEAADAGDLRKRLAALPGFGPMKARIMVGVIAKHLGVRPTGWEAVAPDWPTLADVSTVEERIAYQEGKRAHKRAMREEAARGGR